MARTHPPILFSLPLLPDYLEDALDQLGICAGDAEAGDIAARGYLKAGNLPPQHGVLLH